MIPLIFFTLLFSLSLSLGNDLGVAIIDEYVAVFAVIGVERRVRAKIGSVDMRERGEKTGI